MDFALLLVQRMFWGLLWDYLVITADDGQVRIKFTREALVFFGELFNTSLHVVAQLNHLIFCWKQFKMLFDWNNRTLLCFFFHLDVETPDFLLCRTMIITEVEQVFLNLLDHVLGSLFVFKTVTFLRVDFVRFLNVFLHRNQRIVQCCPWCQLRNFFLHAMVESLGRDTHFIETF